MEQENQIVSLKEIADGIQKTIDLNDSNLEDKDGTPLGFQFPKQIIEKLDEARFLCLLTDAYLTTFGEFFEGDMSITAFLEKLDKAKAALK
jgi:uncharacterized protein (UPF0371 family)